MNKIFTITIILSLSLISVCCGTIPPMAEIQNQQVNVFSRESILKLKHSITIEACKMIDGKEECITGIGTFVGSGSVVHQNPVFSVVLTAAHVCKFEMPPLPPGLTGKIRADQLIGIDIYGEEYELKYVVSDTEADQCLVMSTKPMKLKPLIVAPVAPREGDRVYTMGYPLGFYSKNVVYIGEGFYLGNWTSIKAAYNLMAKGGSSGSPILNTKGELVGLIHSGFVKFEQYIFSPSFNSLKAFLSKNLGL